MAQIIIDSSNNLIQGDFDNATVNNRTKFKTTTLNGTTNVYAVPNGSSTSAGYSVSNAADPTNASKITIATNGSTDTQIISGVNGSGTYLPLNFYTNNALSMTIDTANNVGIGTSSPGSRLEVSSSATSAAAGFTSTNTNSAGYSTLQLKNTGASGRTYTIAVGGSTSGNAGLFYIYDDTAGGTRLYINSQGYLHSPPTYSNTTGAGANLVVEASGQFVRSTSSLKYKRDVQNTTHGLNEVMQLRPVTYKGKSENDGETVFGGLIAEEVDAVGLTEFVQYADDGTPDALAYGNMVSLLTKAIQEQQVIINELKTRIEALESK